MHIHNIRLGHATNSSSSHSFVFAPRVKDAPPKEVFSDLQKEEFGEVHFGWQRFTLASQESKDLYMAAMLRQNLTGFSPSFVNVVLAGLGLPTKEASIDHQSVYTLPLEFGGDKVNLEFFKEFHDFVSQKNLCVLGGNDNSVSRHRLLDNHEKVWPGGVGTSGWSDDPSAIWYSKDVFNPRCSCRKDGDWWTLFSGIDGNRVTLSFKDNPDPYAPKTPLLMDLKITDFCDKGCAYCYQGSTVKGKHMPDDSLWYIAQALKEAQVFEVAIGGGEPTECPSFLEFLKDLNHAGIRANFTTKSLKWLENETVAREILPLVGAFAYSIDHFSLHEQGSDYEKIMSIINSRGYPRNKFTVQVVPAVMVEDQLKGLLKQLDKDGIRATLLGFKDVGRGEDYKAKAQSRKGFTPFDESKWLDVLVELADQSRLGQISIDTTLASRYQKELETIQIPSYLYHIHEGKYSMYLDLVQRKFGPSSYHVDLLQDAGERPSRWNIEEMFSKVEPV